MSDIGAYKNVFDDQNEFNKLYENILGAIQQFSDYRKGNLTYGEIMFVMECILDNLRSSSEKNAKETAQARKMENVTSFTALLSTTSRLVETLLKKGVISSGEEKFILRGEED
jgi:hypothetical protein